MSNLENLKKQAKQVLRWHRDRHWPVAQQLRHTLPAFADLTDREVFERELKLADAQEFVARRAGFESWEALKRSSDAPGESAPAAVTSQLLLAKPCLMVSDVRAACSFYEEKLGFGIAFLYGEPPFYAEILRDGVQLSIRHIDGEDRLPVPERRRKEELLSATILVDGVKPLFQAYLEAGVPFFQKLRTEPWGRSSFIVEDPDGNLLAFSEA